MNELIILLIEDNHDHQLLAEMAIKRLGYPYRMITCQNSEEVAEFIDHGKLSPHIVLLDLHFMDGKGGFEIADALKHSPRTKDSGVIIFTGQDDPESIKKAEDLGVFAYLVKDIRLSVTVSRLKRLVDEWVSRSLPATDTPN